MKTTATSLSAFTLTATSAFAHPSLHHTGHESTMHDAWWALFVAAVMLVGFAVYHLYRAK